MSPAILLALSQVGWTIRTAQQWREEFKLVAMINAGMYQGDFSTHTGFFRLGKHVNSSRWVKNYQSVLLLGPRTAAFPGVAIRDSASGGTSAAFADLDTVIQNLRLIREPGANVWQ